jgi:hypothetical protein
VQALKFDIAVIQRVRQMRCCAAGFAAGDGTVVEDDNASACSREKVGGRKTGDSGADDADIRLLAAGQQRAEFNVRGGCPDRLVTSRVALH